MNYNIYGIERRYLKGYCRPEKIKKCQFAYERIQQTKNGRQPCLLLLLRETKL